MPKIQIKRGSKAKLPTLAPGEFGLATDAGELYIGGAGKNLHIPVLGDDGKLPPSELPPMDYDPAGSAAAVQQALTAHRGQEQPPRRHGGAGGGVYQTGNTYTGNRGTIWTFLQCHSRRCVVLPGEIQPALVAQTGVKIAL